MCLNSGGARGRNMRTLSALPCIIGVVRDSWKQGYFSVYPIRKAWADLPTEGNLLLECPEGLHPIHLSENWAEALKSGLAGSSTEISELSGLSSGRVRQIIRMSNMRPEIVSHLKKQSGKKALRKYSQKKVQAISAAKLEDQVKLFEEAFSVRIGA